MTIVLSEEAKKSLAELKGESGVKMSSRQSEWRQSIASGKYAPSDCESCPAAGEWDWKGPGYWCFHSAYFLGKAAKPVKCSIAKQKCLLNGNEG